MNKSRITLLIAIPLFMVCATVNAQWLNMTKPINISLDRGSFPDPDKIFVASSSHNMLYKSINGGISWDSISFTGTIIDVEFINPDTGFVLYYASPMHPLAITTDGGNTWSETVMTSIGPFENLQRMKFTNFVTGHFVNNNAEILRTVDQGATITNHSLGTYAYINDVEQLKSDTIIMTGADGTFNYMGALIRSNDGGMNWVTYIHDSLYSTYTGSHFINGMHGYIVYQQGWMGINSRVGITMNGGLSIVTIATDTVNTHQDIFMKNQLEGYVTTVTGTNSGMILKTTDGASWTSDFTTTYPVRKFFNSGDMLYGIGDGGTIIKKNITIGIDENELELNGKIYPNPTNGLLNMNFNESVEINIFDVSGRNIFSKTVNSPQTLDLNTLTNGIYLARIVAGNKIGSVKIVLER